MSLCCVDVHRFVAVYLARYSDWASDIQPISSTRHSKFCQEVFVLVRLGVTATLGVTIGIGRVWGFEQHRGVRPPATSTAAKQVKNVIVVTMQNASFDHLFGTFPGAAGPQPGDPGYVQMDASGQQVSPYLLTNLAPTALPEGLQAFSVTMDNGRMDKYAFYNGSVAMGYYDGTTQGVSTLWSYAQQYALADNYFSSVIGEAPSNQLYMIAANDNNVPYSVQPSFGPCEQPDPAATPLDFPNVGDQMTGQNITWAVYQQSLGDCSAYVPLHDPFQFFITTHAINAKNFSQFASDLASNNLPSVSFIYPNNASDMHPGYGPVDVGTTFLDQLVQSVQNSPYWRTTAILSHLGHWGRLVQSRSTEAGGFARIGIAGAAAGNFAAGEEGIHFAHAAGTCIDLEIYPVDVRFAIVESAKCPGQQPD